MVKRGEIWLVTLDPTVGSEIQKTRPCLVVSPDELNGHSRVMIVAPLTSGSRKTSYRVSVRFKRKDGLVLPDQIRAVDRGRLVKRLGVLEASKLSEVLRVLQTIFDP